MGCVSSNLLNRDDEFPQLGSSALGVGHHIVSLTSTTYGLLNLDPPSSATTPPTPPPRFTLTSASPEPKSLWSEPRLISSRPEVINSWDLMSGLDAESFRFSPLVSKENADPNFVAVTPKPKFCRASLIEKLDAGSFRFPVAAVDKENRNPNAAKIVSSRSSLKEKFLLDSASTAKSASPPSPLDKFEILCPPDGENRVVIYTTTLRGIRKTFEDCNTVRSALESLGIVICERDISMDRGFREELRQLMRGRGCEVTPPQVFVKGRYVGGMEDVLQIVEEGWFQELVKGMPKKRAGEVCEGCGDVKFLPCFRCNGSCKMVVTEGEEDLRRSSVVRCSECNENGLVLCPICT